MIHAGTRARPTGITIGVFTEDGATTCTNADGLVTKDLVSITGLTRVAPTDLLQIRSVSSGLLSNEIPLPTAP